MDFINSVGASLVAMLIGWAIPLAVGYLNRGRIIDWLDRQLHPIREFNSPNEFLHLFKNAIKTYSNDWAKVCLVRALPIELTDVFICNCVGDAAKNDAKLLLTQSYLQLIEMVVQNGKECWDKSIFGRIEPSEAISAQKCNELNLATYNVINKHYFIPESAPGTTEIGIHDNLNEFGVILCGKARGINKGEPEKWEHGFLIVFSEGFDAMQGFYYNNDRHIATLYEMFKRKQSDALLRNNYVSFEPQKMKNESKELPEIVESRRRGMLKNITEHYSVALATRGIQ